MTPIPNLPTINNPPPPTVAYAAGLICERRSDLARRVRVAAMNDYQRYLTDIGVACSNGGDQQGAVVCGLLHEIMLYGEKHRGRTHEALRTLSYALCDKFEWIGSAPKGDDLALPTMYLYYGGFAPCWEHAKTPNDLRCLRRLIPIHAHTVSLDATVRAAWAQAHLDALL